MQQRKKQRVEQKFVRLTAGEKAGLAQMTFDYKKPELLRKFLTESGTIIDRKRTGLTAKQQRRLSQYIKRARHIGLLPFITTL